MIHGTLAAALTPLTDGGGAVDADAIGPYVDFLAAGGVDGILALGSTGEGFLLEPAERRLVAETYREATSGRLDLAVHAGAMTTATTAALAGHAASIGADAVAVIAPPYFAYRAEELYAHFAAAAAACAPTPFFVYEFAARSGYAIPVPVIERLRDTVPSFAGMKVSDTPFEAVRPYLLDGLAVFVGNEPLIPEGLEAGAVGSVSALASIFPEVVSELVREPTAERARRAAELRAALDPFVARAKAELSRRGLMRPDVRAPLLPA